MTKISTFTLYALVAIASVVSAAPVAPSPSPLEVVVAIPSLNNTDTDIAPPLGTITSAASVEATPSSAPTIGISAKGDPFSTSVEHKGKATWFTHHYGACNYYWNGYKEAVVALNAHQMGIMSWGNPVCNRKVRVVNRDDPSKTVVARIVDKCPGDECAWGSLDLSPFAFKKLGHLDTGILNITWNYI
ncbi:hypothetical protein BGZ75_002432 [Mortierella antarctica]|nr:hypothetical protein BGZ67_010241 [Mortierella alpina]KAF9985895.1 hypothetical protein BGZ75_002432 [Mortierella antarctica]